MMNTPSFAAVALSSLLGTPITLMAQEPEAVSLPETSWTLIEGRDEAGALDLASAGDAAPTLVFGAAEVDDSVAGYTGDELELHLDVNGLAGVNTFRGSVDLELDLDGADAIEFGPLATTRMAGTAELMGLETRYLQALDQVETVSMDETGKLILNGDGDSSPRLVFAPTVSTEEPADGDEATPVSPNTDTDTDTNDALEEASEEVAGPGEDIAAKSTDAAGATEGASGHHPGITKTTPDTTPRSAPQSQPS